MPRLCFHTNAQMKAAQSVAEAAGVPLPDEDGDNDEDVCKSKTSALEHSTGTSMLNPRNTSP